MDSVKVLTQGTVFEVAGLYTSNHSDDQTPDCILRHRTKDLDQDCWTIPLNTLKIFLHVEILIEK